MKMFFLMNAIWVLWSQVTTPKCFITWCKMTHIWLSLPGKAFVCERPSLSSFRKMCLYATRIFKATAQKIKYWNWRWHVQNKLISVYFCDILAYLKKKCIRWVWTWKKKKKEAHLEKHCSVALLMNHPCIQMKGVGYDCFLLSLRLTMLSQKFKEHRISNQNITFNQVPLLNS